MKKSMLRTLYICIMVTAIMVITACGYTPNTVQGTGNGRYGCGICKGCGI